MDKSKVFMIMPFKDEFFEVYEMLKLKFSDRFEFSNAGDEANLQNILKDIIQPIYESDVIIADLTGLNANVMYELGLAHSFNKKTIIITKDDLSSLPFDLKQYRAKDYDTHFLKFNELLEYLETNLIGAIENTVSFSNPVKDFLTIENINDITWFSDKAKIELEEESDKGFLDFLTEIETHTSSLVDTINCINKDMTEMNTSITSSTSEVQRVQSSGGGSASFVRKESKKIAKAIGEFSEKLRDRNKSMSDLWDKIEKNTLGLLENTFASNKDNLPPLIEYLRSLYGMKISSRKSKEAVIKLRDSMEQIIGLERSMNQAARFAIGDLSTYIDNVERIESSISTILSKSKYVVGPIDFEDKTE